jgi:hypothetical protein
MHNIFVTPKMDQTNGRTGELSEDEEIKLKDSLQMHGGKKWGAIIALVPGRTKKQCEKKCAWLGHVRIRRDA